MIRKYRFGNPYPTDAAVREVPLLAGVPPYFATNEKESLFLTYQMAEQDAVFGLGENVRGINKRGWIYESLCSDQPSHTEDQKSLYAAHNFLIVSGKEQAFGVFFDYAGVISFDIGYTEYSTLRITPADPNLDIYIVDGASLKDIVKEFRGLIGRSYIPPKWAFGLCQSRWSYFTADEVREVAQKYREHGYPLDAICLDIDYMERYKDFTVDEAAFPDFAAFNEELKAQGIRLVPIIDAGVKVEDGYDIYEEGVANNYFCKTKDGKDFVAGVWPGRCHFPDSLNPSARRWFGSKYKLLTDQGVEGFWNDMNEPAIFYTEEHLQEVYDEIDELRKGDLDIQSFNRFRDIVSGLGNYHEDYTRFYHNFNGEGEMVRHDRVHNLFGYHITRAAGEAMEAFSPEKRLLLYSRSSCIGMHRYAGIWCGDNFSWWSHLLMNIKMAPSLNMVGLLYTGSDLGGFNRNTTADLMLRWMEFGIFTPIMRNHAAWKTRPQETYLFGHHDAFRGILGLRYALMPYIYSEFMKAALRDEMYIRPLIFDYPDDPHAVQVEDQLMVGESLMVAPVYTQNAAGRYVYLPERMKMVKFRSIEDYETAILEPGHHYLAIALEEVAVFIRPNHLVPYGKVAMNTNELDDTELRLFGFVGDRASYELYRDDGFTREYDCPAHFATIEQTAHGTVTVQGENLRIV